MSETLPTPPTNIEQLQASADRAMQLGSFSMDYAQVERVPRYESGRRENDAEHSLMLGFVAVQLAGEHHPELNGGLVMQYSAIHDAPEVITGDVSTFRISEADRLAKEAREAAAAAKLIEELPAPWGGLLERYEQQIEPEARLVRLVDKILPPIAQYYGAGVRVFREDYGVTCRAQLDDAYDTSGARLRQLFPEFPIVHDIRDLVVERMKSRLYGPRS